MRNWFFFFNEEQRVKIDQLRNENYEEFKTWFIFTVFLPLLPFFISMFIHVLIDGFNDWGRILNNGSIPIISFGIISSGIIFLMEKLKKDDLIIEYLKRRVMAIAVVMLFITAALFIFQSLVDKLFNTECSLINFWQHAIMFIISVICLVLAARVGQNMFFLQKQIIDKNFAADYYEGSERHGQAW